MYAKNKKTKKKNVVKHKMLNNEKRKSSNDNNNKKESESLKRHESLLIGLLASYIPLKNTELYYFYFKVKYHPEAFLFSKLFFSWKFS